MKRKKKKGRDFITKKIRSFLLFSPLSLETHNFGKYGFANNFHPNMGARLKISDRGFHSGKDPKNGSPCSFHFSDLSMHSW